MQKKLLFLGGSHFQLPPIEYAKQEGHYIITCDYLPSNPGHQLADEYYNVSTTDLEAVLELARRLNIDGIVAYGSDPAAATAAYVASELGLPGNPYESVCILTRKDLYREFLKEHGFRVPFSAGFDLLEDAEEYFIKVNQPLILKPVDSSGSRGVCCVKNLEQLREGFLRAISFSRAKKIILEELITRKGYQIAGDGFVADGRLAFSGLAQEHFIRSGNPLLPIGESFPLLLPDLLQTRIFTEIDRLVTLLRLRNCALNLDIMLNHRDEIYLIEVAPRAGGNLISELIKMSTGVDLVRYVVEAALGENCRELCPSDHARLCGFYALNAAADGVFERLEIDETLKDNVIEQKLFVLPGAQVWKYRNSSDTLGGLVMRFSTPNEMLEKLDSMSELVHVITS